MSEKKEYHKKTKLPLIIALATVLIALIVIMVVLVVQSVSPEKWVQKQLETGARYLFQMDYEQAIASYRAAIEIDPKSEEAYLGLAEAYVGMGEYEDAVEVLTDGYECTDDEVIMESLADVYLKWPESVLARGTGSETDIARALEILQDGYEHTGDRRLTERIAELTQSVAEEQDSTKATLDNNVVSIDWNYCIVKYEKQDVKVRQFPPSGSEVAIVNGGDLFSVLSSLDSSDGYTWYQILGVVNGCTINGYIRADCVNYNPYVVIKDGKQSVKIRALPVNGIEVAVVSSGDKLQFIGSEEGEDGYTWYHVMGKQSDKNYTGYVRADFVDYYGDEIPYDSSNSEESQSTYVMGSLNNPYVVIKDGKQPVKIRALPVNGSEVAVVNSGDKLQVIGSKEGEDGYTWYHVMGEQFGSTYTGYVRADFVDYYGDIIPYDSLNSNDSRSTSTQEFEPEKVWGDCRAWTDREDILPHEKGGFIVFGAYEQDNDLTNGPEPIEWQVLDKNENGTLLISRFVLDAQPYNSEYTDITWADCTLRQWMNNDFINSAFTEVEQGYLKSVTIQNPDNPVRGTPGGRSTKDRVFALSADEVINYYNLESLPGWHADRRYGYSRELQIQPTEYARNTRGVEYYIMTQDEWILLEMVEETGYSSDVGGAWWWLRSPGYENKEALDVPSCGGAGCDYWWDVDCANCGVRPALYLEQ